MLRRLSPSVKSAITVEEGVVKIKDESLLLSKAIDDLVYEQALGEDENLRAYCRYLIWEIARQRGIYPASIHEFYIARASESWKGTTVPALNLRGLTYDSARAVFRVAKRLNTKTFIFEIARSEIGYTAQPPAEYASTILAAGIKEGYVGPVFIQGDHFQVNAKNYKSDPEKEIAGLKSLIDEAIAAGFYNIDIDTSTLVDLSYEDVKDQQRLNYQVCAELVKYIREKEPEGITISVGGEIGEVGEHNSTPEELRAFVEGLRAELGDVIGISKVSVQTGTSHGGVVLPDGSVAKVKVDFEIHRVLGDICRKEYGIGGTVQHGASTLPDEMFHKFVEVDTLEIHLATGFQNIIYDSPAFPTDLKKKIYDWLYERFGSTKKPDETDEQFIYKNRKRGFGQFKKELWTMPEETRRQIAEELERKFEFLFSQLGAKDNADIVEKYVKKIEMKKKPEDFGANSDYTFEGGE